ncbi:MAG TPA: LacI family DNA-binding transcriptional regulator, partial [Luteimonas sp.]|nr:LacI family DNA-binding transcriptional regulator [Luteimonas sp.]
MRVAVTIKDVAREAHVSVATVSRALNGHDNVAAAVRARVLQVAGTLRYSPHHAARSLSSRRTGTIGVVLPDLHGEFFSELMRGIDLVARERGLHLLVSSYHGNPVEQGTAMLAMRGRVDGLLVMSPSGPGAGDLDDPLQGLPSVLINTPASVANTHGAISVDNHGGALAMMQHLRAAGHARIAFIAGPADNFDARERRRGYLDASSADGSAPWVVDGDFSESSGCHAGEQLLAATSRPDAVFAANDMMALGCL